MASPLNSHVAACIECHSVMLLKSSHSVIVSEKTEDASGHIWSHCPFLEHHVMLHTKTFSDFNLISICFTLNLEEAFSFSPVMSLFSTEGPLSSIWSKNCQSEPQSMFSLQWSTQALEMRSSPLSPRFKVQTQGQSRGRGIRASQRSSAASSTSCSHKMALWQSRYNQALLRNACPRKRPWCWERLRAGGEGDGRGWDGWMASPAQWIWVWVNSRSWWWTGRPGVMQSMGSHSRSQVSDWTELIEVGASTWIRLLRRNEKIWNDIDWRWRTRENTLILFFLWDEQSKFHQNSSFCRITNTSSFIPKSCNSFSKSHCFSQWESIWWAFTLWKLYLGTWFIIDKGFMYLGTVQFEVCRYMCIFKISLGHVSFLRS